MVRLTNFMGRLRSVIPALKAIRKRYWPLIKSLQTFLLLTTGVAGYLSVRQHAWQLRIHLCNGRELVPGNQRQHSAKYVV